ncbi:MAG TPA: hypothetical protein VFX65_09680 [Candidatus Limnocylindrales bacterium]|nr:hypothetical protein [Candidatus Limnocylindrales bacterium]
MGFLDRAKQAASQAAEQARQAAEQARHAVTESADKASAVISDPETANKARQALTKAKRGLSTAIDKIDPAVLADVVIKATALQERANAALKAKGSPYRIAEISIGAAIPPSVSFAISRTDDPDVDIVPEGAVASTALLAGVASEPDVVQALDGTQIDEAALVAAAEEA